MTRRKGRTDEIPSREECLAMLRAAGCTEEVVAHCEAVSHVAVKIARRCGARVQIVEAGALLHDIGRSVRHSIDHAVLGAELARELALAPQIVMIIERHIGAGILEGEAAALGLPERNYVPETLEEKIVAHSDNLIAGVRRVTLKEAAADLIRRGLRDASARTVRLHEELSQIAGIDVDRII